MSFKQSKPTDPLVIVGPRDTQYTRSELPSIPPISLKRGWVRPRDLDEGQQVPSSRRKDHPAPSSGSRPRP